MREQHETGRGLPWSRAIVAGMWCLLAAGAGTAGAQAPDLSKLSIEDLINVEITTASRKEQALSRTAAAVYVITDEDIRRSGARAIPDLLRMVPGFSVAGVDASAWAVSARGFNSFYANKLLVLVDGRSVYTPLFAGVNWDMLGLPLTDIQRIEVVRGPGGSLWGANAVNGVVNIITKSAEATQGGLATASLGGPLGNGGMLRYGGRLGAHARYRVFGRYATAGTNRTVRGFDKADDAGVGQGGIRVDWTQGIDEVSVQASVQDGQNDHVRAKVLLVEPWSTFARFRNTFTEGNTGVRWTRTPSSRLDTQVQASYSGYTRAIEYGRSSPLFTEDWQVADVEARQRRLIGRRHEVVAGVGYRFWTVSLGNTRELSFLPPVQRQHLGAAFVQHELTLGTGVHVTSGLKVERNSFTGFEHQPNLRVVWNPVRTHAVWASASRAVRTPSISDRSVSIPAFASAGPQGMPVVGLFQGSPSATAELLHAYEAGYRAQFGRVFADIAAFANRYHTLMGTRALAPTGGLVNGRPAIVVPVLVGNASGGRARGVELSANWAPAAWWRLGGSWAGFAFDPDASAVNGADVIQARSPAHQLTARSYVDLPRRGELSVFAVRVGSPAPEVPAYTSLTLRTSWPVTRTIELALGVENLLHDDVVEFNDPTGFESSRVRTGVFGDLSWRF